MSDLSWEYSKDTKKIRIVYIPWSWSVNALLMMEIWWSTIIVIYSYFIWNKFKKPYLLTGWNTNGPNWNWGSGFGSEAACFKRAYSVTVNKRDFIPVSIGYHFSFNIYSDINYCHHSQMLTVTSQASFCHNTLNTLFLPTISRTLFPDLSRPRCRDWNHVLWQL